MEGPTTRLGLVSKPTDDLEDFENLFPVAYAADIQKIDDVVQIAVPAAVGKIPVYDENGFLISSGIAPGDIEVGVLESILNAQGKILYRNATELAGLAADIAGKSLLTQGPGANPVFGYPSHGTLLNLNLDHHTQYVLRSLLSARGSIPFRGATVWQELVKGTVGQRLVQGANDPVWATTAFSVAFPFGDGSGVLVASNCFYMIPIASKITKAAIRSVSATGAPLSGSVTCTLYKHDRGAALGTLVDTFAISSATNMEETGLSIAVAAGNYLTIVISGITTVKQIVCTLTLEPT